MDSIFRYFGYLTLSLGLGWASNLSGDDNDFILKISSNLIPLLITILAFYITVLGLILKELAVHRDKTGRSIKPVLKSIKRDINIEISIIAFAFLCYVLRGALVSYLSECGLKLITIGANAITVFSFMYFLSLIYDVVMGLWALIEANNE